jgi:hypothetical protein
MGRIASTSPEEIPFFPLLNTNSAKVETTRYRLGLNLLPYFVCVPVSRYHLL